MKKDNIESLENLIEVGIITKPFGIKGFVYAIDFAEDYPAFKSFKEFYLKKLENENSEIVKYNVEEIKKNNKKVIIKFENINSRDESETLKKCSLFVLRTDIPLEKGEYLFQDLIGCVCFCEDTKIGKVISMPNYGTCDMFEIKYIKGQPEIINIPYFKEIIEKIDINKKIIYFKESYKDYI